MSITLNDIFTRAADRLTGSNTSCVNPISRVNDRLPPNRFEHLHRQLLVVPFDRRLLARGTGIPHFEPHIGLYSVFAKADAALVDELFGNLCRVRLQSVWENQCS